MEIFTISLQQGIVEVLIYGILRAFCLSKQRHWRCFQHTVHLHSACEMGAFWKSNLHSLFDTIYWANRLDAFAVWKGGLCRCVAGTMPHDLKPPYYTRCCWLQRTKKILQSHPSSALFHSLQESCGWVRCGIVTLFFSGFWVFIRRVLRSLFQILSQFWTVFQKKSIQEVNKYCISAKCLGDKFWTCF